MTYSLGVENARLREALAELEAANEALCDRRSQETYLAMASEARDELYRLDEARADARSLLAALPIVVESDVIAAADLLRWLRECRPHAEHSDSDHAKGVVTGFDIIIAQLEQGHLQASLAALRSQSA